jgi:hypothetical protein
MKFKLRTENRLTKLAAKGFRGYPLATVAYYGPDDRKATKVAVGIFRKEGAEAETHRWLVGGIDARLDDALTNEILALIRREGCLSVGAVWKILGCPHEEVKDYPAGQACPQCPFWAGKDRWEGVMPRTSKAEMLAEYARQQAMKNDRE